MLLCVRIAESEAGNRGIVEKNNGKRNTVSILISYSAFSFLLMCAFLFVRQSNFLPFDKSALCKQTFVRHKRDEEKKHIWKMENYSKSNYLSAFCMFSCLQGGRHYCVLNGTRKPSNSGELFGKMPTERR